MKKGALERALARLKCEFLREGKKHEVWINSKTGKTFTVPRHAEVNELTARDIIKKAAE